MTQISKANTSHIPSIVQFQLDMAMETENLVLEESIVKLGIQAVFRDTAKGTYYVAEIDGKIVGSLLTTYEWSDWRNGQILWIQSVYILKEFRGQGVFKEMYEFIKSRVVDQATNFRGIRLYVDKTNEIAQKVYEKLDMENHHYEMYEWMAD